MSEEETKVDTTTPEATPVETPTEPSHVDAPAEEEHTA